MDPFKEDPRMKTARRGFWLAWGFFSAYLFTMLLTSHLLGVSPLLWGLPRWVAIGNVVVPVVFVLLLILVVEKGIPDIPLDDPERPIHDARLANEDDGETV